jgi:two-component system, OmpR family, sensor histidine kinase VicK
VENAVGRGVYFMSNVKQKMDIFFVDELRHLDGVRGGIAINESEYMHTAVLQEGNPLTQVLYSNVKEVVEQEQYIFDTLWNEAIPAEKKIREFLVIENNPDEIIKQLARLTTDSKELATCLTPGGMQYSYNYFFDIKRNLLETKKRGT